MYRYRIIWLFAVALLTAACSSDTLLNEKHEDPSEPELNQGPPMVFGSSVTAKTRSSNPLETLNDNFKVSVWKSYGDATAQQNVMDGYRVNYEAATESTPAQWNYVDVVVGSTTQIQRYWDLSSFPYEFRAVSPYLDAATIETDKITLDVSAQPFTAQTYIDEVYNVTDAESEPCVMAHVSRQKLVDNYVDTDVIKGEEINETLKALPTREVRLPFHHLISKVGFRIFIDDPQPTSPNYMAKLNSITISAVKTGFITKSETYTATTAQGLDKGTFSDNTTSDEFVLLQHGLYQVLDDNDNLVNLNLRDYLSIDNTYDLCPNYLQQIPQGDIQIRVQAQVESINEGVLLGTFNYNTLLSLNSMLTTGDLFTWEPEKRYIYNLRIPNLHRHEVVLESCEVLPWDEVQSSDIPINIE